MSISPAIDATHDPRRRSWVESANGHPDFPIQNLPIGIFSNADPSPRPGVAIGDSVLDLRAAAETDVLAVGSHVAVALRSAALNPLMALGSPARRALREAVSALLDADGAANARRRAAALLSDAADCTLHLPARIGDYTDFYAGIHHATTVGSLLRPENPLMPNYRHLPVGYHGRASSIRASGGEVIRPCGQRKRADDPLPHFAPCSDLDYEVELGIWIGQGNPLGEPIAIAEAGTRIFGYSLLNDWSARDIQRWEYQPLGPFLAKNFASHVSPWIVTSEALAPFRAASQRGPGDPPLLPHLADPADQEAGALDIDLEVLILTPAMRRAGLAPAALGTPNASHLYWTPAQMVAHHSSNGCNLAAGDLLGSGTVSSPFAGGEGSLIERNRGGTVPIALPNGETRTFLEDGDEVILRGHCAREGFAPIGFGEVRATVAPARVPGTPAPPP